MKISPTKIRANTVENHLKNNKHLSCELKLNIRGLKMDIQVLITKMKQIQGELKTDIQGMNTKMKQIQGELKIQGVNMEMKQVKGDFQNPIT